MDLLKDIVFVVTALAIYFGIRMWLFPRLGIRG